MNIHLSYNEFYSIINIYYNLLFFWYSMKIRIIQIVVKYIHMCLFF